MKNLAAHFQERLLKISCFVHLLGINPDILIAQLTDNYQKTGYFTDFSLNNGDFQLFLLAMWWSHDPVDLSGFGLPAATDPWSLNTAFSLPVALRASCCLIISPPAALDSFSFS